MKIYRLEFCFHVWQASSEEAHEHIEALRRENKNLAEEIKDIHDQMTEGGRGVHEMSKSIKRLEMEKEELQTALEDAEAALENEEAKVLRAQLAVTQVRSEIDKRLHEKDEEFEVTRKNHQRAIDTMQATLETESRGRAEALRQKVRNILTYRKKSEKTTTEENNRSSSYVFYSFAEKTWIGHQPIGNRFGPRQQGTALDSKLLLEFFAQHFFSYLFSYLFILIKFSNMLIIRLINSFTFTTSNDFAEWDFGF